MRKLTCSGISISINQAFVPRGLAPRAKNGGQDEIQRVADVQPHLDVRKEFHAEEIEEGLW